MSKKKKIIAAVCTASVVCLAAVVTGFAVYYTIGNHDYVDGALDRKVVCFS